MTFRSGFLSSGLALLAIETSPLAHAQPSNPIPVLPTVTVVATNAPAIPGVPSLAEAQQQKVEVPGGLSIIDAQKRMERSRGSSFQDLLGGVPGVTLQSENGMEATKYSSRGSGILSDDEPVGVNFLLDGFPFNQADGEVILEDFSLGSIKYAEVFRGANAFKYGAITMGGAVNLASKTGYDTDPFQISLEGGSYGFWRSQVGSGGVSGNMDYYATFTGRGRDGYREHSYENTEDLYGNLGYRFSESLENRVYLSATRTDRLLPGGITQDEMNRNPTQAIPEAYTQHLDKEWYYVRVADKLSYKTDAQQADAGAYWWHRDLQTKGLFDEENFDGIENYTADNFGVLLNSTTRLQLFGQDNNLTVGLAPVGERQNDEFYQNDSGQKGAETGKGQELSINIPFYAEDQQYVTEKLSLLAGFQAIYVQRRFTDEFNDTASGNQSANLSFSTINPKFGSIYELDDKSQLYANVSRSWQPPSFDNMLDFDDDNPPPPFGDGSLVFTPLQPQHAWTVECGTRGERGRFAWDLSLYHSWVRNELLEINNASGVDVGAVNINRSMHQGIEAGLQIELLDSLFVRHRRDGRSDHLALNQTYTLNDFHFDDDAVYGNNRIAGIPIHLYQVELMYQTPFGLYAGLNLQCNLTEYPVDQANSLNAAPYALVGFKMGWQSKKGFSVFFQAMNLGGTTYAAAVDPVPDARTGDGPPRIFHPGDGRSFYLGVSWAIR